MKKVFVFFLAAAVLLPAMLTSCVGPADSAGKKLEKQGYTVTMLTREETHAWLGELGAEGAADGVKSAMRATSGLSSLTVMEFTNEEDADTVFAPCDVLYNKSPAGALTTAVQDGNVVYAGSKAAFDVVK